MHIQTNALKNALKIEPRALGIQMPQNHAEPFRLSTRGECIEVPGIKFLLITEAAEHIFLRIEKGLHVRNQGREVSNSFCTQ